MEWTGFTDGEFATCKHGYYFIYKRFNREMGMDRWFADYERGSQYFCWSRISASAGSECRANGAGIVSAAGNFWG